MIRLNFMQLVALYVGSQNVALMEQKVKWWPSGWGQWWGGL